MQDFQQAGTLWMSAITQWQGQKAICQNHHSPTLQTSFTCQLKLFFTPDICVGFPSCPQIESQIRLPPGFLSVKMKDTHWIHKQGWGYSTQGRISCPVVQQIVFPPSPHPQLEDILPIINKHEAERFQLDIWRHFGKGFTWFVTIPNRRRPLQG